MFTVSKSVVRSVILCLPVWAGVTAFNTFESGLAAKPDLWTVWQASDETSTERIDHSAWQTFLDSYLITGEDGINRVRYSAVTDVGRTLLDTYIETLAGYDVTDLPRAEQRALWTNLYNALTVRVILDHYPVDSILDVDISPGLFADGPWGKKLITIEDHEITLDDIEHRILRPIWNDPRVHFSVNCAALGCPNLSADAFIPEQMDAQLDAATRAFIAHPRGASVNNGVVTISKIFEWYDEDFGDDVPKILDYIISFASSTKAKTLKAADASKVETAYDWALNEAP